jgi:hypothetical protein
MYPKAAEWVEQSARERKREIEREKERERERERETCDVTKKTGGASSGQALVLHDDVYLAAAHDFPPSLSLFFFISLSRTLFCLAVLLSLSLSCVCV